MVSFRGRSFRVSTHIVAAAIFSSCEIPLSAPLCLYLSLLVELLSRPPLQMLPLCQQAEPRLLTSLSGSSWLKARPTSLATTVRGVSLTQQLPAGKLSAKLIFVTNITNYIPGEKIVMRRNFSFPCMTLVGKLKISPHVEKF